MESHRVKSEAGRCAEANLPWGDCHGEIPPSYMREGLVRGVIPMSAPLKSLWPLPKGMPLLESGQRQSHSSVTRLVLPSASWDDCWQRGSLVCGWSQ